jgi:hypothetical protein
MLRDASQRERLKLLSEAKGAATLLSMRAAREIARADQTQR